MNRERDGWYNGGVYRSNPELAGGVRRLLEGVSDEACNDGYRRGLRKGLYIAAAAVIGSLLAMTAGLHCYNYYLIHADAVQSSPTHVQPLSKPDLTNKFE